MFKTLALLPENGFLAGEICAFYPFNTPKRSKMVIYDAK
jgi:hypothetical protein